MRKGLFIFILIFVLDLFSNQIYAQTFCDSIGLGLVLGDPNLPCSGGDLEFVSTYTNDSDYLLNFELFAYFEFLGGVTVSLGTNTTGDFQVINNASPGIYHAVVFNDNPDSTCFSNAIEIFTSPTVFVNLNQQDLDFCFGEVAQLEANEWVEGEGGAYILGDGLPTDFIWSTEIYGAGEILSEVNTHSFNIPISISDLFFTIVDENNCTASKEVEYTQTPLPTAEIAENNINLCVDDEIIVFNLNQNQSFVTGLWQIENDSEVISIIGSNDTINMVTVNADSSGNSNLSLTITTQNGICSSSDTIAISIYDYPEITNSTTDTLNLCVGDSLIINPEINNNYEYSWFYPDSSEYSNDSITFNTTLLIDSGNYILNVNNEECISLDTTRVIIHANPIINYLPEADTLNIMNFCDGSAITFEADTNSINHYTYEWFFNTDSISNLFSFMINSLDLSEDQGDYEVFVLDTITNCSSSELMVLNIDELPFTNFSSVGSLNCQGGFSLFYISDVIEESVYHWEITNNILEDSLTILNDSFFLIQWPNEIENYIVTLNTNNNTCMGLNTINVSINEGVAPSVADIFRSSINNILYYNDFPGCYQWGYFDPNSDTNFFEELEGEIYQSYVAGEQYDSNRIYWCKAWEITNGNCDSEQCPSVSLYKGAQAGIEETDFSQYFELYPNPSTGDFRIEINNLFPNSVYQWKILDSQGKLVKIEDFSTHSKSINMQIETDLSPGLYFIGLFQNGKLETLKNFEIQ